MKKLLLAVLSVACLAVPASALAEGPYEPNDSLAQAFGPLAGGSDYAGALETSNDVDWYRFYSSGQSQVDIHLTNTGTNQDCTDGFVLTLADRHGEEITETQADMNESSDILQTLPERTTYYLIVTATGGETDCPGPADTYSFRIDPASAVTSVSPADSPECKWTTNLVLALQHQLANQKRHYRHSHRRKVRRKWKRRIATTNTKLRHARRAWTDACY